jgi:predicted transcriptional regulator
MALYFCIAYPIQMNATNNRQLELSQRVLAVKSERLLDQIDEMLMKAEMQARFEESLDDIANGRTVTLDELRKDCDRWIRKTGTAS